MVQVSVSVLLIYFDCVTYMLQAFFFNNKNFAVPKKMTGVILHPYLPMTGLSLQLYILILVLLSCLQFDLHL